MLVEYLPILLFIISQIGCVKSAKQISSSLLNDQCSDDADCAIAWSYCKNGKCVCLENFVDATDGYCRSKKLYCPAFLYSNLKEEQTAGDMCVLQRDSSSGEMVSNCTNNGYCFLHGNTVTSEGDPFGHCCPKPPSNAILDDCCPVSVSFKEFDCLPLSLNPTSRPPCPSKTHSCISHPNSQVRSCCPNPCSGWRNEFPVAGTGRCYQTALRDESCLMNAQCIDGLICKFDAKSQKFLCGEKLV